VPSKSSVVRMPAKLPARRKRGASYGVPLASSWPVQR